MGRRERTLFSPGRTGRPGCLAALVFTAALLALMFVLNQENNRRVVLEKLPVTLPGLSRELEGFAILHISDLHAASFGDGQEKLRSVLEKEVFQAVCMTGDMVGAGGDPGPLLDLIDVLPDGIPVFLIAGDDDPEPLQSAAHGDSLVKAPFVRFAEEHGALYLDFPRKVEYGGRSIWFCPELLFSIDLEAARFSLVTRRDELLAAGDRYSPETGALLRMLEYQLDSIEKTFEAKGQMGEDDLLVMLSHFPPDAERVLQIRGGAETAGGTANFPGQVALMLAGHYNNGQLRLPWLGPVYVPPAQGAPGGWFPGEKGIAGLSTLMGVPLHVSPGLGASGAYPLIPLRLFNTPVITIVSLTGRIT